MSSFYHKKRRFLIVKNPSSTKDMKFISNFKAMPIRRKRKERKNNILEKK
jgi:hypothetical protein